MTFTVIRIAGLTKNYGDVEAVRGIDLEVQRGEVVAVLGPNGAGKTTTVEILEGYRARSGGTVEVLGLDPDDGDDAWRSRLGIVHQSSTAADELLVEEVVAFHAAMYPDPLGVPETLAKVDLADKARARCGRLSGGQQRRLDVALGIVGRPELLFLDEPTTGLDPEARRSAWELVESLAGGGTTILLTTHYLEEAERLAGRVAVINGGLIVAEGTPADLGGRAQGSTIVRVRAEGVLAGEPPPVLRELAEGIRRDGARLEVRTHRPTAVVALLTAWAADGGIDELPGFEVARPSLEDIYLSLTQRPDGLAAPDEQKEQAS